MMRFAVLGLLASGPLHGYALRRRLEANLGAVWTIGSGRIYQELHCLQRDGLVALESTAPGARGRRRFRLTSRGAEELGTWLGAVTFRPRPPRQDLLLRLAVLVEMGVHDVRGVLEAECVAAERHAHRVALRLRAAAPPVQRLALEAELRHTEAHLSWLDRCATVLQRSSAAVDPT